MSLRLKTETAFRQVLRGAGIQLAILRSCEEQATQKSGSSWVNIRAVAGQAVSPRSGNRKFLVLVTVESAADRGQPEDPDPVDAHSANVGVVRQALDDVPDLAFLLSAARADIGGAFTCFFVVPQGEVTDVPPPEARAFRDTWVYQCTVAESDSTA